MNTGDEAGWQRPQAWLYAWDFARDSGRFLNLDRATLQRSSFLDQRIATDAEAFREVPIADLLSAPIAYQASAAPGFILHSAFCCSTLLARSLDLPGRTLVLREPATLLQLADRARGLLQTAHAQDALLDRSMALLTRPFAAGERAIVKPTNLANNLAPELLAQHPGARAIVLYDELEAFLLSVLKRPSQSETGIAQFLRRLLASSAGRVWLQTNAVPDSLAGRAALAWSLQIRELRDLMNGETGSRVRVLSATELLATPATALAACAEWLGIEMADAEVADIARGTLWTRHAKHPDAAFTPAQRRAEQDRARRLLAEPLQEGLRWTAERKLTPTADFAFQASLLP